MTDLQDEMEKMVKLLRQERDETSLRDARAWLNPAKEEGKTDDKA